MVEKTNTHLSGVKCIVNTCYYNDSNAHYCKAEKIEIQPQNASSTSDTDCGTFKPMH